MLKDGIFSLLEPPSLGLEPAEANNKLLLLLCVKLVTMGKNISSMVFAGTLKTLLGVHVGKVLIDF